VALGDSGYLGPSFRRSTAFENAVREITAIENETSRFVVNDSTGETTFRAWVVPETGARQMAFAGNDFMLSTNNPTAAIYSGVLTFTGSGIIEVTPLSRTGGTLHIVAGDDFEAMYVILITEPHECHSNDWVIYVPPTIYSSGIMVLRCDTCEDLIGIEVIEACDNHHFTYWILEIAPTSETAGIKTRTCENCGLFEFDILPVGTVFTLPASSGSDMAGEDTNGEEGASNTRIIFIVVSAAIVLLIPLVVWGGIKFTKNKQNDGVPKDTR